MPGGSSYFLTLLLPIEAIDRGEEDCPMDETFFNISVPEFIFKEFFLKWLFMALGGDVFLLC